MSILVNPNDKSRTGEASTILFPKYHEFALVQKQEGCPAPTKDVALNLQNREKGISVANYGPMNPNEPNEEFWSQKAQIFGTSPEEAKKSLCGNCAAFDKSPNTLNCIETGLGGSDSWDTVNAGQLGYCKMFEFKCASSRTCDAWITGGPITDNQDYVEKAKYVVVGQMVSWNSSGGRAEGKVTRVITDGKYKVPNTSFEITGTKEDPAAAIKLYRDGKPTDQMVGHKVKTLTIKKSVEKYVHEGKAPVRGADKFSTKQEALSRAKEIGCEGTHSMDENGETIYMPCSTHGIYEATKASSGEEMEKAESVKIGDMVSWNNSGGRAQGKVIRVIRDGKFKVPNSSFVITGTPEDPAAEIRLFRGGEPTETIVGHKVKTLTTLSKSQPSMGQVSQGGKPDKKKENYKY